MTNHTPEPAAAARVRPKQGRSIWPLGVLALPLFALGLVLIYSPAGAEGPPDPLPPPLVLDGSDVALHGQAGAADFEDSLVEMVNMERWNNGQLPPLKKVDELDSASESHSSNQATRDFFGHCDLDTWTWPDDRMIAAGYYPSSWGENIAAGYGTPTSVMAGWMGSSGHRANILSSSYREIGLGYFHEAGDGPGVRRDLNTDCVSDGPSSWPYYHYWTQNFGRRNNVYPVVINREAFQTSERSVSLYMYGSGWAQEMRFCNTGHMWSEWTPFNPDASWTLHAGNGLKTVLAEIRNGDAVISAIDTIWLEEPAGRTDLGAYSVFLPFIGKPLVTGEYCEIP